MRKTASRVPSSPGSSDKAVESGFWPGFLLALVMGAALGALYDGFRVLHMVLGGGKRQRFLFDLLFMTAAALATFIAALAAEAGQLRFYLLAGEGIGMCVWALTFGELTLWAAQGLRGIVRWVSRLLRRVVRRLFGWFCRVGRWVAGKFTGKWGKKRKNNRRKRKKSLETKGESSV